MMRRWLRWRLSRAEKELSEWVAIRDALVRFEDQVARKYGLQPAQHGRTRNTLLVEGFIRDLAHDCARLKRRMDGRRGDR